MMVVLILLLVVWWSILLIAIGMLWLSGHDSDINEPS